jgi:hypothetical protein
MGATLDDIATGARRLRAATDRALDIQAPVKPMRGADGAFDPVATMAALPELAAAGVTNVYLNAASVAGTPAEAQDGLARLVDVFRRAQ